MKVFYAPLLASDAAKPTKPHIVHVHVLYAKIDRREACNIPRHQISEGFMCACLVWFEN